MVKDYYHWLLIFLNQQDDSFYPCMYVAGSTYQQTLDKAVNMGLVRQLLEYHILFVRWTTTSISSSYERKALAASGVFEETMTILKNAIVRCCTDIYANGFEKTIVNGELKVDPDELRKRKEE